MGNLSKRDKWLLPLFSRAELRMSRSNDMLYRSCCHVLTMCMISTLCLILFSGLSEVAGKEITDRQYGLEAMAKKSGQGPKAEAEKQDPFELEIEIVCTNLGLMYQNGKGVTQSTNNAVKLYEKACNIDYGLGCNNLGWLYYIGSGVKYDANRASALFYKSCKLGNTKACNNQMLIYMANPMLKERSDVKEKKHQEEVREEQEQIETPSEQIEIPNDLGEL